MPEAMMPIATAWLPFMTTIFRSTDRAGTWKRYGRCSVAHSRRREFSVEWLRWEPVAEGARVVCSGRKVGYAVHAFEPPLPLFEVPLVAGRSWSWTGEVGGVPGRLEASSVSARDPRFGAVIEVVHELTLDAPSGERRARRVLVFSPDAGWVGERWQNPADAREHHAARAAAEE